MATPAFPMYNSGDNNNDMFRLFNTGGGGTGMGSGSGSVGMPGQNQYTNMSVPATVPGNAPASSAPPGIVPPSGGGASGSSSGGYSLNNPLIGGKHNLGGGANTIPTMDPALTTQLFQWLQSQIGQGATPFNLSAILPSSGQATAPGTLTAPLNAIDQQLENFYQTGQGGPMAGVLPMWNAAISAMNSPTGATAQNEAMLKGAFAAQGTGASSPYAQAMQNFASQNTLNQNALLTQATLSALPTEQSFGSELQTLDQASINNLLQEFIRTQPEYSPLLNMLFGAATSSQGVLQPKSSSGLIGGILGGAGGAMTGIADLASAAGAGGLLGAI